MLDMGVDGLFQMHHLAVLDIVADKANIVHRRDLLAFADSVVVRIVVADTVQAIGRVADTAIVPSRYLTAKKKRWILIREMFLFCFRIFVFSIMVE